MVRREHDVKAGSMKLTIRPLTPNLWPALEDLFGDKGACGGCWCMYWRIGRAYRNRPRGQNKGELCEGVKGGPPGLGAFGGDVGLGRGPRYARRAVAWL